MDPLPQPNFERLTQGLTTVTEQISLVPNIPTIIDGQAIAAHLAQITQQLAQQAAQFAQQLAQQGAQFAEQLAQQGAQFAEQLAQQGAQITRLEEHVTAILGTVTAIRADIGTLKDDIASINLRLDASEINGQARLYNSNITSMEPLFLHIHDRRDRPVNGFPENGRALARLTGDELSTLLEAYGQPTDGSVPVKRKRFRRFIGVVVEI